MSKANRISEAIVLAGGKGTRLKEVVSDVPKPMAPVAGFPFLYYILDYLYQQKMERIILSVGYKHEVISSYFGKSFKGIPLIYSIENEPLGTGGAIKKALGFAQNYYVFVLNGDTYFPINIQTLYQKDPECVIAAQHMANANRYGTLVTASNQVIGFNEKSATNSGLINGGIYLLKRKIARLIPDGNVSFETEVLPQLCADRRVNYKVFEQYFMDIGIPADYLTFQMDRSSMALNHLSIDKSWTLFLDRDGVINERLIGDYVKRLEELKIIKGVPEAIKKFTHRFKRIVVVTNQQGIGKGLMTADDLHLIHNRIEEIIEKAEGRIEKFYFAPQLASENSNDRKPGTGMGLKAQDDFPDINFDKCVMIGDSESDIEFGMKLGMKTIMLKTDRNLITKADYIFENLHEVANALE